MALTQTEQFFYDHAGYSIAPGETERQGRERGARKLATDEAAARDMGFSYRWSIDPDIDSSEFDTSSGKPWALWQCAMYNPEGRIVNSLHGIDFGRDGRPWGNSYQRVVEAELAAEGLVNPPQ